MKISNRIMILLNAINISENAIYYDIGCDHGIIGYSILSRTATSKVVFSDVSKTNLNKAKNLCLNSYENRIDFILCDGVYKNASTKGIGIIFGLGGETIIEILEKNKNLKEFYLSPATSVVTLREYIYNNNYSVISDKMYFNNNSPINILHIKKSKNQEKFNQCYILFGRDNLIQISDKFKQYLQKRKNYLYNLLANIDKNMLKYNISIQKLNKYKLEYYLIETILKGECSV